jgi:hypothetical protein
VLKDRQSSFSRAVTSRRRTIAAECVRTPILAKMLDTWLRTVFSLLHSYRAIALLSRPSATRRRTLRSAGVSASSPFAFRASAEAEPK